MVRCPTKLAESSFCIYKKIVEQNNSIPALSFFYLSMSFGMSRNVTKSARSRIWRGILPGLEEISWHFVTLRTSSRYVGPEEFGSAKVLPETKSAMSELHLSKNPKGIKLRSLKNEPNKWARRKFLFFIAKSCSFRVPKPATLRLPLGTCLPHLSQWSLDAAFDRKLHKISTSALNRVDL